MSILIKNQIFNFGTKDGKPADTLSRKHSYVLQPVTGKAKYSKLHSSEVADSKQPLQTAVVNLDDVTISLSKDGYRDMMKLADNFATFNQRLKYAHFRPLVPVKADSRSWWKYAYRAIEKRRKVTYGKWEEYERSLASYIKKHACSNSKTEDLWAALEEGSGEPVNKLMTTWTKQQGYPVVSVKVNNQNLEFDQSQFLSSRAQGEGQWIVPITLCFGSYDVHKNFLFQTKSETRDVKELLGSPITEDSKSWIKINVEQAGFYRVKYDELLAAKLRYAIEKKILSPSDRFGILDDTYALCNARKESLTSLLNLMAAYREEDDYTVLSNLISISSKVQNIAADAVPDLLDYFKQFSINVLQYSAERLGWDPKPGETHDDALLRGEILTSLAEFGHDLTLDEASRRFQAFLENRNTPLLPPDIRRAVYVAVMKRATKSNRSGYESLLKLYRETDLSQEKTRILGNEISSVKA
ncbi:AP-1 complex subunit mu-1-like [Lathyrus oleraceus]|uniref:AP-1 complex subunit mu-1-like n=3 Tax=Pisum sativum TaxID=3888 RepID=A0A9D4VX62_PEA|nr:AP-1 complex subunit mu-1-like [Pisum sativum]